MKINWKKVWDILKQVLLALLTANAINDKITITAKQPQYKNTDTMNYKFNKPATTSINVNTSYQGETIEEKINRIVNNKEPITDGAPIVYTERKNGVEPQYNIRTDRFEIAIDAMDKIQKTHAAKRAENIKNFQDKLDKKNAKLNPKNDGGAEPTQGTEPK